MPDKLAEAVKVFDQYAWAVWLLIFFVLIAPPSLLAPFAVGPFVSQYRPYIGALFLASTVLLLGRIGQAARDRIVP
jgi:hypothetical protein